MTDDTFRDSIATINKEGKRNWIFPKKPKGNLTNWRNRVSIFLLALLFAGPYLKIGGEPILMVNVLDRKFVILGQVFWPQDFYIFGFIMITFVVFIVLFTVIFGRIWCGWMCPQTIFMENVFRKIEYWIEGDFKQQQALDKSPWNAEKIRKKAFKQFVFFFISFYIANTFLAYIIGIESLTELISEGPAANFGTFASIVLFTGVFYWVFAWFREQVCIIVCPYGRLQGVLLDKNSIVVAYDHKRGEERGLFKKNETRAKGDCIDCKACVNVCPTGIDIRNGTQLECVNCTACIDACDFMMEKVDLPKGLIRFASENNIAEGKKSVFNFRIGAYSAVLSILIIVCISLLLIRADIDGTILRTPGIMYQEQANGHITNLYNYKIINKTNQDFPLEFRLLSHEGIIKLVGNKPFFKEDNISEGALFIELDKNQIQTLKTKVKIGIYSGDKKLQEINTTFLGPS
ncbi:MAG: cytochrome c oxidase accessory protein CcoG [Bacteroidetes bacterium]|nr:cytochrome c oxidase accessory protein CcoG [Bacteroidota bacterium]